MQVQAFFHEDLFKMLQLTRRGTSETLESDRRSGERRCGKEVMSSFRSDNEGDARFPVVSIDEKSH